MMVPWFAVRNFIDQKIVSPQYVDLVDSYWIKAIDSFFSVECIIKKTSPINKDQKQFEDSYKSLANRDIVGKMSQVLGKDKYILSPRSLDFTAQPAVTTVSSKLLNRTFAIRGGVMCVKDFTFGDWVKVSIIDQDNVLGYGPGFSLADYVPEWKVLSGINELMDVAIGELPCEGLYFVVEYHSDPLAVIPARCLLNLISYEINYA